ncbi:AEC family transporter [Halobellus ruber]|uniref:AEC family transporter n=1 Tax=Halobellus ruber TaxID=2761102 RepID=A0A7J9SIK9_9EURY|nr:AEC family transporter [Halobellus ruber]
MVAPVSVFTTAILPIVAVGGVGYLLGWARDVDTDALNTVVVYVLAPALVFHSLATTTLAGSTLARITVAVVLFHVVAILVAEAAGRAVGASETALSALILVTAFPNTGNYGIPVSNFAFGETGRATAVVALSVQAVLIYTLGVYIAGRGSAGGVAAGVRRVFGVPLVYAVTAALGVRWLGLVPPADTSVMATLRLVGDSAIPVMLLLVGIQLARTDVGSTLSAVGGAVALKTLVAPVLGVGVALAVGFADPLVARTIVLETAMPSAVTPIILVGEFAEGEVASVPVAEFVSTAIFATTLVSVVTLTAVIAVLQTGVVV